MSPSSRRSKSSAAFKTCLYSAALALVIGGAGCSLVDLREVPVETFPSERNQIVAGRLTPLYIAFPVMPDIIAAEKSIAVSGPSGNVQGEFSWSDSTCSFIPSQPWEPAVTYYFRVNGNIPMTDGRMAKLNINVRFYVDRADPGPRVLSFTPVSGAVTSVFKDQDARIQLVFSEAMDRDKTEKAFTLRPAVEFDFAWNPESTELTCVPKSNLQPCVFYTWNLSVTATSADGAALRREETGSFYTTLDTTPPELLELRPASLNNGAWELVPGGTSATFEYDNAIAFVFSEEVSEESLVSALKIEPSLQGHTEKISQNTFVFIPTRPLPPQAAYTAILSTALTDASGLHLVSETKTAFSVQTPFLAITSIEAGYLALSALTPLNDRQVYQVAIGNGPDFEFSVKITFSEFFDIAASIDAANRINLSGYFPSDAGAGLGLKSVSWPLGNSLLLEFSGLKKSTADKTYYYKLTIPGGSAGIVNGYGSWFEKDLVIFLEVLP